MGLMIDDQLADRMDVRLCYDPDDPLAVTLEILDETGRVTAEWLFSRELLEFGSSAKVGEGDVVIQPRRDEGAYLVHFWLRRGSTSELVAHRGDVEAFLSQTRRVVAVGLEPPPDVDALILDILRGR
jgi:hypothetical protein